MGRVREELSLPTDVHAARSGGPGLDPNRGAIAPEPRLRGGEIKRRRYFFLMMLMLLPVLETLQPS